MGKLKSNILYNLTYQILNILLPLLTMPYLSRVLGVDGIGTYAYVFGVCYSFYIVVALGLSNYGNRAVAQVKGDRALVSKTFWSIYFMQLATGLLVISAYVVYLLFFVSEDLKLYFIVFSPFVISAVFEISWFFFGLTEFKFTAIRSCTIKLLSVAAIFLFVKQKDDLIVYFLIMAATHFVNNAILWTRVRRNADFYLPCLREVTVHFKPNLVLFTATLALNIYRVIDKIMIKIISGVTQNGYYENANNIIQAALTVFSAVAIVMMPAVSNMVAQGKQRETKILLRDSMQVSMFLGFGLVFGLIAVGPLFAPIFFGAAYDETGVLIQLLAVTVIIAGWTTVIRSQYIIPHEKDTTYALALIAGAVINVVCNLIFIPMYRARGAVIGTVAAELMSFAIQTAVARKDVDILQLMKDGCIFAVPGTIMAGAVVAFLNHVKPVFPSLLAAIFLGVVIYLVLGAATLYLFDRGRMQYFVQAYFQPLLHRKKNASDQGDECMLQTGEKTNSVVDISKMFWAFVVVAHHTDLFAFSLWADRGFGLFNRLCIPFFFITSAFFCWSRGNDRAPAQIRRIGLLYLVWCIIYLTFDIRELSTMTVSEILVRYFWNGNEHAMWYLWACVIAFTLIWILLKKLKPRTVLLIGVIFLVIGVLKTSWAPFMDRTFGFTIPDHLGGRNGLFYAFPYTALGMYLAKEPGWRERPLRWQVLGMLICGAALVAEAMLMILVYDTEQTLLWMMVFPTAAFYLMITLRMDYQLDRGLALTLRKMSTLIYVSHGLFLMAFEGSATGIYTLLVFGCASLFALLVIWLSEKEPFHFLKILG